MVLEKMLESPSDSKEIKPVNPKGNQLWIFIGRTEDKAEAPILWPPYMKSWLIEKDPDTGKNWEKEEKGATEDEMVKQHHQLNGHEFEQTPGDKEGQRNLMCCSSLGRRVGHNLATEQQSCQKRRISFLLWVILIILLFKYVSSLVHFFRWEFMAQKIFSDSGPFQSVHLWIPSPPSLSIIIIQYLLLFKNLCISLPILFFFFINNFKAI